MATWNELTTEQKTIFSQWADSLVRPAAGELARVLYHLDLAKAAYANGPDDIMALLDSDAVIPNTGGLSGAVPVTKTQMQAMLTALNGLLTGYYTEDDQERYMALAGAANILG